MKELLIPAFGENCLEDRINQNAKVFILQEQKTSAFDAYCALLEENGFSKKEENSGNLFQYAAYENNGCAYFLNFFSAIEELSIVREENTPYFSYCDTMGEPLVQPQITQLELEDFGMSYAIRLSDGRFILIDGGREFLKDAENLLETLRSASPFETPVIAAWILTHPHCDHFHCFHVFMKLFGDQVKLEKVFLNFPDADDFDHFPTLAPSCPETESLSPLANIPLMWREIERSGAKVYTPHTGQSYQIGDAKIRVLCAMDEILHRSHNINASSLAFQMELGGQMILWTGDLSSSTSRIGKKYGDDLKADILQVPHHGFRSGNDEGEILAYDYIRPKVCLLPVADQEAYVNFCAYREGTLHLMTHPEVEEVITGTPQRTISLPYPLSQGKQEEIKKKLRAGRNRAGANTFIFSDLSTDCPDDLSFTLLNTTHVATEVRIDLYFDSLAKRLNWKTETGRFSFVPLSLAQSFQEVLGKELPKNEKFAIRFSSDIPIVVSHKTKAPIFFSNDDSF